MNSESPCTRCSQRAHCLPAGLDARELARLDSLITSPHRVRRGNYLIHAGTDLNSLFAIRSGSLKSSITKEDGREQIMGFYLAGELLGMDAIGGDKHLCDVVALEDAELCHIPFTELQQLSRDIPALGRKFNRMMSAEIGRAHNVMLLLGSMRADERLAAFLLSLSHRFRARGYSPTRLVLPMTRHDIGSYLGLKLETVSRMFSQLKREAMIAMQGKEIRLIDLAKLTAIMRGAEPRLDGLLANANAAIVMCRLLVPPVLVRGAAAGAPRYLEKD